VECSEWLSVKLSLVARHDISLLSTQGHFKMVVILFRIPTLGVPQSTHSCEIIQMAILEGIEIKNFRSLKHVTLGRVSFADKQPDLPRLIAVIGSNGVGKSSLLDVFGFLGDCLLEGIESACDKPHRGGLERLRTLGQTGPIAFEIRYRETEKARPISYTLEIDLDKRGRPMVTRERFRQRRKGQKHGQPYSFLEITRGKGRAWAGQSTDDAEGTASIDIQLSDTQVLGISVYGALSMHPRISAFKAFLGSWYLSYFVPQLARSQPISGADPHLNRTGENLSRYLQFIHRERPKEFKELLVRIAKKIPGLQSIKPVEAPDKRLVLAFKIQGFDDTLYQQDMSDGTLKMLAYLLLMEDPHPAAFVGIEEPENGLNHQLLTTLAEEFKTFSDHKKGPQVLITTHAPNFVDALSPEEVWILSKDTDGFSKLTRASDLPNVKTLYDEGLPMGSLWFSQHLEVPST
jgi:predicted ATPase